MTCRVQRERTLSRHRTGLCAWTLVAGVVAGEAGAQPERLARAPHAHAVVVVIDDTQVSTNDSAGLATLLGRLGEDLVGEQGETGVVTVGPAGLNVDLTSGRGSVIDAATWAARGDLASRGKANVGLESSARIGTLHSLVEALASRPGAAKVILFIGRSSALDPPAQVEAWQQMARDAQASAVTLAWFDLGSDGCGAARGPTDATVVAGDGMCASVGAPALVTVVIERLRAKLSLR